MENVCGDLDALRDGTHSDVYSIQAYAIEFDFSGGDEYNVVVREIYEEFNTIKLL